MNGATALLRTLVAAGVRVVFANPGTSEMPLVAALDAETNIRAVPTLFEGVATGAADGYARMTQHPAATLLHLGPGFANGLANLHNARRARTPLVNVVGDQATYHQRFDARLQSDLWGLARTTSSWQRWSTRAQDVAEDAADAVAASLGPPGAIATLLVPADVAWSPGGAPAKPRELLPRPLVPPSHVEDVARTLVFEDHCVLLIGGDAMREPAVLQAARAAHLAGARLYCETFPPLWARGGHLPSIERLAYDATTVVEQLAGARHLILAGARAPAAFFAHPDTPSDLVPATCQVHLLAGPAHDVGAALDALVGCLATLAPATAPPGPRASPSHAQRDEPQRPARPERPAGPLTPATVAAALGHLLPEGAIVVDESISSGYALHAATERAPRHDWLSLAGGAIGQGLPVATGAAVAQPDRRVICVEADGSAMYTVQSLWTQARESLSVTTLVMANRAYAILRAELARLGGHPESPLADALLDLSRPPLDFVSLARGMGVPAARATSAEELCDLLERSLHEDGPTLVEVALS